MRYLLNICYEASIILCNDTYSLLNHILVLDKPYQIILQHSFKHTFVGFFLWLVIIEYRPSSYKQLEDPGVIVARFPPPGWIVRIRSGQALFTYFST